MQTKSITLIEEIDNGSTTSFDNYLSKELGAEGTKKRKANDNLLETTRLMMVLKEMRKIEKIKLKTVAHNLGVDESVVSKLENSNKDIQLGTLINYLGSMNGHAQLSFTIGKTKEVFNLI